MIKHLVALSAFALATGAIANAIYNATGKRVRDFPITPDKLMRTSEV